MGDSQHASEDATTIDVIIEYEEGDDVHVIDEGMASRLPPRQKIRGVSEVAQMVIAGSLSIRVLADGVVVWVRTLRSTGVVVDARSKRGPVKIYAHKRAPFGFVLYLGKDGQEEFFEASDGPDHLVERLARRALG